MPKVQERALWRRGPTDVGSGRKIRCSRTLHLGNTDERFCLNFRVLMNVSA